MVIVVANMVHGGDEERMMVREAIAKIPTPTPLVPPLGHVSLCCLFIPKAGASELTSFDVLGHRLTLPNKYQIIRRICC